VNTDKKEVRSH